MTKSNILCEEKWGSTCDNGSRQSPIDMSRRAAILGHFTPFSFENWEVPVNDISVFNTGHSFQINSHPNQGRMVIGGGLPGIYQFVQMHFHWGSEHTIDGQRYALELHIVLHESRFSSITEAIQVKGGVAVLGILFHVAEHPNPFVEHILLACDGIKDRPGRNQTINHPIILLDFLPRHINSYFRYEGSLTTPQCGENVLWTVFTESTPLSVVQVERFKEMRTEEGHELTHNYRSVKPLNARALIFVTDDSEENINLSVNLQVTCILYYILPLIVIILNSQ